MCFKFLEVLTHIMGSIQIGGLRDFEIEQIESEAKEHTNGNRSKYARQRLRAGRRLWNASGELHEEKLDKPLARDKEESNSASTPAQTSSLGSSVKEVIYKNLSTSDPIPIESDESNKDDLVDLVIEDVVVEAIEQLQREEKVQHKPRKGYIKNE